MTTASHRPLHLTAADRRILTKHTYYHRDRARMPHLYAPFEATFRRFTLRDSRQRDPSNALWRAYRMCAQMMLDLDCTYWGFTWAQLLPWRDAQRRQHAQRAAGWRQSWNACWTAVTTTLFFLEVLPYDEAIYQANHAELADKWFGREVADALRQQFVDMALTIGYRDRRQVLSCGAAVVLSVLTAKRATDLASITKADLEAWEAQTHRSRRVARQGVTIAQKVLAAMGYLQGAPPRRVGGPDKQRATWGRTAPAIVDTFVRFLADLRATRRPETVEAYELALRRFGDWLGHRHPTVRSVQGVERRHIEAYKQTVAAMRCGDYTSALRPDRLGDKRGAPLSAAHQVRCISCVRTFFETIDALEYPERPGRQLFLRGDVARVDQTTPRFLPDPDYHRFVAAARSLTPDLAERLRLPPPYERTMAIIGVLLECGLRAGELCRLDTGCVIAAQDAATGATTSWLRVPVGKLYNDRVIPIRPALVTLVDTWMRRRGPQPLQFDERTGTTRDLLFTWHGAGMSRDSLNTLIGKICGLAGVPRATSHQFRHTLAVQWRKNGMKLETISRLLGHKDLRMTLRYAAVMPETVRREFDAAFAAIDEEYRTTAQVRVLLSPDAHLAAAAQWRESLWVDLGIGFCGLTAYLPCDSRLSCLPCPHFIATAEHLPVYEQQRRHLVELRILGETTLPADRQDELASAISALDQRIVAMAGTSESVPGAPPGDD